MSKDEPYNYRYFEMRNVFMTIQRLGWVVFYCNPHFKKKQAHKTELSTECNKGESDIVYVLENYI